VPRRPGGYGPPGELFWGVSRVLPRRDPLKGLPAPKSLAVGFSLFCWLTSPSRPQCDEQHPICKNCQKSKRECLGYDPIFKQQQQHPTSIQPAPNHPAPPASVPSNGPAPPPPSSTPTSATSVSSVGAPYASLPPVLPSSYTPTVSSSSNTPGASYELGHPGPGPQHQHVKGEVLDYGAAIDPALDSVGAPPSTSTHLPPVNAVAPGASSPDWRPSNSTPSLRGGGPLLVSHVPASPCQQWIPAYPSSSAKKMRVDELVSWGRSPAPKLPSPPTQATLDEIRNLYAEIYAPGLDAFFESKWFTLDSTSELLMSSYPVIDMLAGFLSIVGNADQNNKVAMNDSANLEFRVVWDLACLANTNEARLNTPSTFSPCDDGAEARHRVSVLDTLLSGGSFQENPLVRPPPQGDYQRLRELDFWYHIGEFLLVQPAEGQPTDEALGRRDQILARLRTLLDGRENRDVLYSIAIMRALSPEFSSDFESSLPPHLDESDPKSKLAVARQFIQDEAKVTGGTTNIVRRFSELASMAFINPGANVQWRR
jgi:white-opaque regulator 2